MQLTKKKTSTGKAGLTLLTAIITFFVGFIGSPLFYNWYIRPIVVVDIKEFELPKVYTETIQDKLSKIPRINIIEIVNTGRSIGGILSLDFKANNNVTFEGVSAESRSSVFKYAIEKGKDGSSLIRVDMEYIRPNEKVIIKALTDVKANLLINQKLMNNGEIVSRDSYDNKKEILVSVATAIASFTLAFLLGWGIPFIGERITRKKS